jgi:tRNA G18 (ribose-2'-O)-methylase SpoU
MNMTDDRYDPELIAQGDTRNVVDEFRNMTVDAIKAELDTRRHPLQIAIENYQHDFNIGTIVRNANAFNVSAVHIIGRRHWNRRGAMVTDRYMHVYHHSSVEEFTTAVHDVPIIGVDNIPGSQPLASVRLPENAVLVFGGEGPGLSEEMIAVCQSIVAIEQFGSTRSVNVGVASGIVMYSWIQQHVLA